MIYRLVRKNVWSTRCLLEPASVLHGEMSAGRLFLTAVDKNERLAKSVVILGTSFPPTFSPAFPRRLFAELSSSSFFLCREIAPRLLPYIYTPCSEKSDIFVLFHISHSFGQIFYETFKEWHKRFVACFCTRRTAHALKQYSELINSLQQYRVGQKTGPFLKVYNFFI